MLLPFSCFNAVRCVTYQIVEMTVNVLVVVKSRKYSQSIKLCFSPPIDELMNLVFFIELNVLIGSLRFTNYVIVTPGLYAVYADSEL